MNTLADPFQPAVAALAAQWRQTASLDEIMLAAHDAAAVFGCDRLTLYAVDADGDYLISKARTQDACRDVKVAIGPHSIAGLAAQTRNPVHVADAHDDAELARIAPGLRFPRGVDERTGYRTRQVLAVPLVAPDSGALLGVIQLVNTRDGDPFPALAAEAAARLGEALAPRLAPHAPHARQAAAQAVEQPPALPAAAPARAGGDAARLLARIVADARRLGARAIHIEPAPGGAMIRLRRDGVLAPYATLPAGRADALVQHLAAAGGLARGGPGQPRQGTLDGRAHGWPDVLLHATAIPSAAGMDLVLRLAEARPPIPLAQLDMAPDDLARLQAILELPRGLLLVCGPQDAGKSTTLHALLGGLAGPHRKVCTAEDDPAPPQPGLCQVRLGGAAGLDAAAALEAFRQADADVIMVDALRGGVAAGLAIEAALAGRLVLAALPARGAAEGALRLLDLVADPFAVGDALAGVLAQRLVRRLCTACRQPYHPGAAELELLLTEYCAEMPAAGEAATAAMRDHLLASWRRLHGDGGSITLYRQVGCAACAGGYRGRSALFELMAGGAGMARLLAQRPDAARLATAAQDDGMRTLKMDGIDKVLAGITDIGSVRAACAR
ncbi:ATPase, T2SS/T4P/T4SS family [Massilia sp. METH4]|uniref:GspE/PulE family protein n=1 Tax=Massilia sp. METH4 TaxID=3123041 RepID=UPI0030D2EBF1